MAHQHQAKRPYNGSQPSITSYFSSNGTFTTSHTPTPEPRSQPPATVQANLLSVGMRVRKSVPEGYKTGSYSGFTLFSDPTASVPQPPQPQTARRGSRPRARELTPFCGILKVGGMAQQAWGIYNPSAHGKDLEDVDVDGSEAEEDEDDCPFLSQSSTISTQSTGSVAPTQNYPIFGQSNLGNKRRFSDEDEDVMVKNVGFGDRVMAVPRRKKGGIGTGIEGVPVFGFGQENVNDFQDAPFLDYGLAQEWEMGGV